MDRTAVATLIVALTAAAIVWPGLRLSVFLVIAFVAIAQALDPWRT